ncbi:hypothetical protein Q9Q95_02140 [Sphingomonas sp. DG1-23]|uniref:hypothetical protein n=1 Tax=Sphingomonas sp. DG1-23 TaxID=3068316 RepID=UPI00273D6539|nr:hypothetical protein [Sphingomonas sp. DG1-23]MDP5277711.1 hypothetical protein [Sphingomonas sp. DG1-23]
MENNRTEELLNLIGQLLAEDTEYPLDNTLLHAEVGRAFVGPSIFKDRGNHILYRDPDLDRLGDALLDLWEAQQDEKRWAELEYIVRNGRFEATFIYPEEIDLDEEPLDRRTRIVAQYFGDKPIVYPPFEEDDSFGL